MFNDLPISDEEKQTLIDATAWITLLIAGADGSIAQQELEWATKIAGIRAYSHPDSLDTYYERVGHSFQEKLDALISELPKDTTERTAALTAKLDTVNPILAKLDNPIAFSFYKGFRSFAEHIAKSDGGFLRFFSVSTEEKKLIGLPMLTKIELLEA